MYLVCLGRKTFNNNRIGFLICPADISLPNNPQNWEFKIKERNTWQLNALNHLKVTSGEESLKHQSGTLSPFMLT